MDSDKMVLLRDRNGKFLPGCPAGPGRPLGLPNAYGQIRKDILDVWQEENGKERFRRYFNAPFTFEKALSIILAISPKLRLEVRESADGTRSAIISESGAKGMDEG